MNCNCPSKDPLVDIPSLECPFDLKQIQRLAFVLKGRVVWDSASGGGTGNGVPQANSQVDTKADWEARRTAIDQTKIVVTPLIGGDPIIEAGEAITEGGGDNSTLNGVEEVTGVNPSKFSAVFKSIAPETEKALKSLMCASTEVYLFLESGRIACEKIEGTENHKGFNVQSLFVSDRNNEGYGTKDKNNLSFSMASGWSENLVIVKPADFNPLYDI